MRLALTKPRLAQLVAALGAAIALALVFATPAAAQEFTLNLGQGASTTGRIVQLIALMTVLSLAPSILMMVTSFTRIVVVLSFLRPALGTTTNPPNMVIISLALFLTGFIMAPTLEASYDAGHQAAARRTASTRCEAFDHAAAAGARVHDAPGARRGPAAVLQPGARRPSRPSADDTPLRVLIPAFMISELRRAFEIGFLLFLPFLVIDMVVASVLMSMGMMMLPPVTISLPFKLIFFVLVDGWYLLAGSLVQSFGPQ